MRGFDELPSDKGVDAGLGRRQVPLAENRSSALPLGCLGKLSPMVSIRDDGVRETHPGVVIF